MLDKAIRDEEKRLNKKYASQKETEKGLQDRTS